MPPAGDQRGALEPSLLSRAIHQGRPRVRSRRSVDGRNLDAGLLRVRERDTTPSPTGATVALGLSIQRKRGHPLPPLPPSLRFTNVAPAGLDQPCEKFQCLS